MDIIATSILNTNRAVRCLHQKGQWLSKTKREEKEDKQMDMTIPSIILFGCMFAGFAMIPDIIKDSIQDVKDVLKDVFKEWLYVKSK